MDQSVLSPLSRADGSASHSHNGYTVICAVNGPMEVQRREELPEEAVIDVAIRPATGFGGKILLTSALWLHSLISSARRAGETFRVGCTQRTAAHCARHSPCPYTYPSYAPTCCRARTRVELSWPASIFFSTFTLPLCPLSS